MTRRQVQAGIHIVYRTNLPVIPEFCIPRIPTPCDVSYQVGTTSPIQLTVQERYDRASPEIRQQVELLLGHVK